MFFFDLEQFFDSMKYSMLVNTMGIDNQIETKMYLPHNMQVVLFLDLDLMCSENIGIRFWHPAGIAQPGACTTTCICATC